MERLNHLRSGINMYVNKNVKISGNMDEKNDKNEKKRAEYPLIIFDHFEALSAAMKHCDSKSNRETLSFILYSLGQFATNVCHDTGIAHVMLIGDELFTSNNGGLTQHLKPLAKHCQFFYINGIAPQNAKNMLIKQWQNNITNVNQQKLDVLCAFFLILIFLIFFAFFLFEIEQNIANLRILKIVSFLPFFYLFVYFFFFTHKKNDRLRMKIANQT